jgi:hypothetical protein
MLRFQKRKSEFRNSLEFRRVGEKNVRGLLVLIFIVALSVNSTKFLPP